MNTPETQTGRRAARATDQRPKAALFCPECGHESGVDGDWTASVDDAAGVLRLTCPDCGTELTRRPLSEADTADGRTDQSTGRESLVTTALALWTETVRAWRSLCPRSDGRAGY